MSGQDQPSGESMGRLQVSSSVRSADMRGTVDETGERGKNPGTGTTSVEIYTGMETLASMLSTLRFERERGRINPTIESGCAACALPVGVASAVGMQELNRTPQEYIAANAEKIRELGFKTPALKFPNGDVQNFSVQCHGQIAQTSGGGMQGRRSRQSDRAAA